MDANQITEIANGTPVTLWGSALGMFIVAFFYVERALNNRKGDNMMVKALTEDVARLENRLRDETSRADENEERADRMAGERNQLVREFAETRAQFATVSERLDWQTQKINQQSARIDALVQQNETLVNQNTLLTQRVNELINRG